MSDDLKTLDGILRAVWSRLDQATSDLSGPARTIALATAGTERGASVRMVILRDADRKGNELTFWTNRASAKIAELKADPMAEAVFWDEQSNLQVRFGLETALSDGPQAVWAALGPGGRSNYSKWPETGAPLGRPEDFQPDPDREMFVAIAARILWVDALHLGSDRHRRARFPGGLMDDATWIAP